MPHRSVDRGPECRQRPVGRVAAKAFSSPAAANDKLRPPGQGKWALRFERCGAAHLPGETRRMGAGFLCLHESYPGRQIISEIESQLTNAGWKPLKEDWLKSGDIVAARERMEPIRGRNRRNAPRLLDVEVRLAGRQGRLESNTPCCTRVRSGSKVRLSDVSINGNWMSAAKAQADRDFC